MIVREIQQNERRQLELGAFVFSTGACVGREFIEEFIGAELIGIVRVEIGIERIEVIAQHCLRSLNSLEQWHSPRKRT